MRRLILLRHAKSDRPAGVADHERPLNDRGRRGRTGRGRPPRRGGHQARPRPRLHGHPDPGDLGGGRGRPRHAGDAIPPRDLRGAGRTDPRRDPGRARYGADRDRRRPQSGPGRPRHGPGGAGPRKERTRLATEFPTAAYAVIDFDTDDWSAMARGRGGSSGSCARGTSTPTWEAEAPRPAPQKSRFQKVFDLLRVQGGALVSGFARCIGAPPRHPAKGLGPLETAMTRRPQPLRPPARRDGPPPPDGRAGASPARRRRRPPRNPADGVALAQDLVPGIRQDEDVAGLHPGREPLRVQGPADRVGAGRDDQGRQGDARGGARGRAGAPSPGTPRRARRSSGSPTAPAPTCRPRRRCGRSGIGSRDRRLPS